ncbi:hypothetical protein C8R45DRAFT_934345 [Mycena sanguinolenta]|nr:hypothetical protein C8R45DRAFT_934345 [Mycena sanguinolenta]
MQGRKLGVINVLCMMSAPPRIREYPPESTASGHQDVLIQSPSGSQLPSHFVEPTNCAGSTLAAFRYSHDHMRYEILHSGQYWQDLRRRAKEAKEAHAARVPRAESVGSDLCDGGRIYTFVPGCAVPFTSLQQRNGKLLPLSGPSSTAQREAAKSAVHRRKHRRIQEQARAVRAKKLEEEAAAADAVLIARLQGKHLKPGKHISKAETLPQLVLLPQPPPQTSAVALYQATPSVGGRGAQDAGSTIVVASTIVTMGHEGLAAGAVWGTGEAMVKGTGQVTGKIVGKITPGKVATLKISRLFACNSLRFDFKGSTSVMGRVKTGEPRGRKSDFTGEKQAWLEGWRDKIQDTSSDPGAVYTDATLAWIRRYGYDLPFSENVDGDPEENPPVISPDADQDEKKRRAEIQKKLRASWNNLVVMKKLGNYFRNRWKGKKIHAETLKGILATMQTMSGPGARPRRKAAIQVYSKLHYASRIKPGFDASWEKSKEALPASMRVSMSQDFVRTCWEEEDEDFRADIEKKAEEMHQAALQEWKASRKIPEGSAEEYHDLPEVAIPMADALAERTGCHVVILCVGPIGSEKGEVCLRTVFSDTSNLETSRTWAQFDHKGFTAMESSITRYGRAAFSRAACMERAWPPLESSSLDGLLPINPALVPPAPVAPITAASSLAEPPSTLGSAPHVAAPDAITPIQSSPNPAIPPTPITPDDGIDRTGWAPSLITAHTYLSEKKWGPRWTALLNALIKHEWSFYHQEDDGNLPKMRSRPAEYADWMKEHRLMRDYSISDDFGSELLQWWQDLGPANRWENYGDGDGQSREPTRTALGWSRDWARLQKRGRNGPALLLLGLAWWGQALCNAAAGDGLGAGEAALAANVVWNLLVDDVQWVLVHVLTQDRDAMEAWEKERETELEEERQEAGREKEAEAEQAAAEPVKGKKPANRSKAAPGKSKQKSKPTGGKRKRDDEPGHPPAKKAAQETTANRPKPRPLTRGARARIAAEPDASNEDAGIQPSSTTAEDARSPSSTPAATTQTQAQTDAGNAMSTSPPSPSVPSPNTTSLSPPVPEPEVEAPPVHLGSSANNLTPAATNRSTPAATGEEESENVRDVDMGDASAGKAGSLDGDPFEDGSGLTAEELAEIAMDIDADKDDDNDDP